MDSNNISRRPLKFTGVLSSYSAVSLRKGSRRLSSSLALTPGFFATEAVEILRRYGSEISIDGGEWISLYTDDARIALKDAGTGSPSRFTILCR